MTDHDAKARERTVARLVQASAMLPEDAHREAASGALLGAATALRGLPIEGDQ